MKKLIIAALMLLSTSAFSQIKSASLTASGLTCSMCSKSIFKALSKVPSVKNIDVNVEKSVFTITFKEDAVVVLDEIKKAVMDAGFFVASMKVTAQFSGTEVYNDAHIALGGSTFHFLDIQKQTLQGEKTFTVVDKNYLPSSEHKKYGKLTKMECFSTGRMASCCPKDVTSKRVYHVTL